MQVNPPPPPGQTPPPPPYASPIPSLPQYASPVPGGMIGTPRKRMRRGWIIWGIVVAVLAVLVMIGGAVAMVVSRTASSLDPVAEARTPGTATFVAEKETYDVLLVKERRQTARSASSFRCAVALADGRTISLDGSVQDVGTEVANTESIGRFDAVPGQTSVYCEADSDGNRFVVDTQSLLAKAALWILLGGVALLLLATGLILGGVFLKKPVT